jgi:uncharacterized protein DUF2155
MTETDERPYTRKLILFGVAVAVPLAAVAMYFAIFDQPAPRPQAEQAPIAAAGSQGGAEKPALPPNHPPIAAQPGNEPAAGGQPGAAAGMPPGHPQVGSTGRTVRVPDTVKGKWQAVKLQVEQKTGGTGPQVLTVKLGSQVDIPGSKLRVNVGDFLPALQVSGNEVTSAGNDPSNPAVLVTVSEDGKEIFKGWLFGKFPDMQPFVHPVYKITLIAGVPKG